MGRLDPGQSVAVLIGVGEYPRSDYPSVVAARNNVERLAAALASDELWGLPQPTRLLELVDGDRATVLRTIADAGRLVGRQGMLLVYFVGHAEPAGGELCLAMRDADRSNPKATMVPVAELVRAAGGSRSDMRMLVLDCCFSGRAGSALPGVSVKVGEAAGWYFIGAADGSSEASAPAESDMTLFTAAMVQVLEGVPTGNRWLTPADVWEAMTACLPADHPPVHNDLAWARRRLWVKNRRYSRSRHQAVRQGAAGADADQDDPIPDPPALYAEPRYLGSHPFVGRAGQLQTLDDWAEPAQPHPVLLFEAIGGTGKSMLTWQWLTNHAAATRDDWAGRFWYSFYEKNSTMAEFCRRAVAYMTGRPLTEFRDVKQATLTGMLLRELRSRPWLLVLDGLERVLVAYHRYDASQLADELAGQSDEIAGRDPCSAIRPDDDDLLRQLATGAPSKILITSRLTPRVLLNTANQPFPGVRVERLPGLRPPDAEALLRECGVDGDTQRMRDFLQRHCDCHPLVTGVVAGLINAYLPARGDFDRWAADPAHGALLDIGDLDLVQKRNHILSAALDTLPEVGNRLLSALSMLPGVVGYATLDALNPHRPEPPKRVARPVDPESGWEWVSATAEERVRYREDHQRAMAAWEESERRHAQWNAAPETLAAAEALSKTVGDLERRGLLQYDRQAGRWDLHPVVRATTRARLTSRVRDRLGQQIIDHFSQSQGTSKTVDTLDDLHNALTVARTMVQIGRLDDAAAVLTHDLSDALLSDLEAYPEFVSLARPMFASDWSTPIAGLTEPTMLANAASFALHRLSLYRESARLSRMCVETYLSKENWAQLGADLNNLARTYNRLNSLAIAWRCSRLALDLAEALDEQSHLLIARSHQMQLLATLGRWTEAEQLWHVIEPMDRDVSRRMTLPGGVEIAHLSWVAFPLGQLTDDALANAEQLAATGRNRYGLRKLQFLRGLWCLSRDDPTGAVEPLHEAVRMANEAGFADTRAEAHLALARLRSRPDNRADAGRLARRLSSHAIAPHQPLAELWLALGDRTQAAEHARAAYIRSWADGEPYVRRHDLTQATALLHSLGVQTPALPPHDPASHPIEGWESSVATAIAKLRADD
ncbi:caspase family protein [Phytohabitans aurantiacus]|uniref:caspase family protein n=1 Tax=Phytohabitans aurantiacus TaxID=3016789 RepID=UPI0024915BC4|nr:hypothetical protein [Phytohabitans aurantiacus]